MNRKIIFAALGMSLLGSAAVLAQGQAPQPPMSFFIAANPSGTGNLGGLEGADRICQNAAAAAGRGNSTWRAYLSTSTSGSKDSLPDCTAPVNRRVECCPRNPE